MCDEAIEYFLKGNFSRFDRALEKLDHIKTTNIRNFLNEEERALMQTEEDDFNDRFRNETAGSNALMGLDDIEEEEEKKPSNQFGVNMQTRLTSGAMDKEMQREMLL